MRIYKSLYNKVKEYVDTNYKIETSDNDENFYYMEDEYEINDIIEELLGEIEHQKEEYEKLERDLEDNYIPRPRSDYTGDPDDDRY